MSDLSISKLLHVPDAPISRQRIKWSNGFGNAYYTKGRSSVVWLPSSSRWDSALGVWSLIEDTTASNTHFLSAPIDVIAGERVVISIYAKAGSRSVLQLRFTSSGTTWGAAGVQTHCDFDLSAGTASSVYEGSTSLGVAFIESLGGGWYRCALAATCQATSTVTARAHLHNGSGFSYTGNGTGNILVADEQFETEIDSGPTAYNQSETVPLRSNQAIVRAITQQNPVPYSNTLSDAAWTKTRCSIGGTITLNGGALNGWAGAVLSKVVENTDNNTHFIVCATDSILVNPAGLVSLRFLAQGDGTRRHLKFRIYGDSASNFAVHTVELRDNDTPFKTVVGTASLHSIERTLVDTVSGRPVYEIVARVWPSTTSDTALYQLQFLIDNGSTDSFAGDGTSGIYLGKIQVASGYDLPDYGSDTTAADPAFANVVSAATLNGIAQGVALDAITLHTEDQTQTTPWFRTNIHAVTSEGLSADGYPAYKVDCDTTSSSHILGTAPSQKSLADSSLLTFFADSKADERNWLLLQIRDKTGGFPSKYFDVASGIIGATSGTIVEASMESRGNGWWRCRLVCSVGVGATTPGCRLAIAEANNDASFAGLGANDGLLVSRCFAVEGNVPMQDADAAYVRAGSTMEHVRDRSSGIVTLPAFDDFLEGEAHEVTPWYELLDLSISDGAATITDDFEIEPYVPSMYTDACSGALIYPPDDTADGDAGYLILDSGAGQAFPDQFDFRATEASVLRTRSYGGGTWKSERTVNLTAGDSPWVAPRKVGIGIGVGV